MIDRVTIGLEVPDSKPEIRISSLPLNWQQNDRQKMIDVYRALEAAEATVDRRDGHPQYLGMLGGFIIGQGITKRS
jgi:hypothetical protein